jgi:hypothetical protein
MDLTLFNPPQQTCRSGLAMDKMDKEHCLSAGEPKFSAPLREVCQAFQVIQCSPFNRTPVPYLEMKLLFILEVPEVTALDIYLTVRKMTSYSAV